MLSAAPSLYLSSISTVSLSRTPMASAVKKVNKINQIVRLKHAMQRWKTISLNRGSVAVYVGVTERRRFVIPTRFLNLPIFVSLLNKAEEEFGFQSNGGLVLPCDVDFFRVMLKLVVRDEQKFGRLELDEFLKIFYEVGFDSCKESNNDCHGFTPLLQKTRV